MQRKIIAAGLCIVTVSAAALLAWLPSPANSCAYRASPARFERAELTRSPAPGTTKFEVSVRYRYTADGREHVSERLFCTRPSGLQSQDRIRALAEAVRRGEGVVARWHPDKPDEGCISVNPQFAFNTVHNVAVDCLQRE